jgi:hypothetical protein
MFTELKLRDHTAVGETASAWWIFTSIFLALKLIGSNNPARKSGPAIVDAIEKLARG